MFFVLKSQTVGKDDDDVAKDEVIWPFLWIFLFEPEVYLVLHK